MIDLNLIYSEKVTIIFNSDVTTIAIKEIDSYNSFMDGYPATQGNERRFYKSNPAT